MTFSRHQLAPRTTLDAVDLEEVHRCRRAHNQLGFASHVGVVRLLNRVPKQEPFEVLDELVWFTGVQLGVATNLIDEYRRRRQTIAEPPQRITRDRGLRHFAAEERQRLVAFVFDAASRLVVGDGEAVSPIQAIKSHPGHPSVESMRVAVRTLRLIEETGVLARDLSWLSNNDQRAFFHTVRQSSAPRLREVTEPRPLGRPRVCPLAQLR